MQFSFLAVVGLAAFADPSGVATLQPPSLHLAREDGLIYAKRDDRELAAARRKAVAGLDEFFRLADAPPPGARAFHVKIPIRDGQTVEHFWVRYVSRDGGRVTGVLANEPVNVSNVVSGQTLTFPVSEIEDWNYMLNDKMQGGYSVCVLLARSGRAEFQREKARLGLACQ